MIRILIADNLNSKTIDKLSEIPEFTISEKTNLTPEKFATEIENVEAVVVSGTTRLTSAVLKRAVNLKIIIRNGKEKDNVDKASAHRQNIEIHDIQPLAAAAPGAPTTENRLYEGLEVIAILKDFFNV